LRQALEDMLMKSGVKDEAGELNAPTQVLQRNCFVLCDQSSSELCCVMNYHAM